jgi:hypothetical protein
MTNQAILQIIRMIEYCRLNIDYLRSASGGSIIETILKGRSEATSINLQSSFFNLQSFLGIDKIFQLPASRGVSQFSQCFGLYLADTLAGDREILSHLL